MIAVTEIQISSRVYLQVILLLAQIKTMFIKVLEVYEVVLV